MARKKQLVSPQEDIAEDIETVLSADSSDEMATVVAQDIMGEGADPIETVEDAEEEVIPDATGYAALRNKIDPLAYPEFDAEFYTTTYPDVLWYPAGALSHYALHGMEECRFGSAKEMARAMDIIATSGRFQTDYYTRLTGVKDDPIRDYMMYYRGRISPDPSYDEAFFTKYYPKSLRRGEIPFVTYCRFFNKSWCFGTELAVSEYASEVRQSPLFSATAMRNQLPELDPSTDLATYYCTEGYRIPVNPSDGFSTRGYMLHYPDIAQTQINPFVHYVRYGAAEGRHASPMSGLLREKGFRKIDPAKKTILVVSHEASRSGAPIVGLNLARTLSPVYNVISVLMRRGALYDEYKKFSAEVVVTGDAAGSIWSAVEALTAFGKIDAAILNSIECTKFVQALVEKGVPTVSLVHEFAQYCWPFTLHARAIALSDLAIYPAEVVRDAAFRELEKHGVTASTVSNVVIQAQGKCVVPISGDAAEAAGVPHAILRRVAKADRPFVVMGAGWVQPRKGVDLFVEAARIAKHELGMNCLFIWVGPNYLPERDMSVSVYLAAQVEQSDLEDVVVFVEEQPSLKPFLDLTDAFFLSSRLDPFPNVAIDAIAEGVPVICFKEATGIAELGRRWPDRVMAASYNSVTEVAQFMLTLSQATPIADRPGRIPATPDLDAFLAFQNYSDHLAAALETVMTNMTQRREVADLIYADTKLDAALLHASLPDFLKSPGLGAATTRRSLADLLAVCCRNGIELGYLWPGKFARLPQGTEASPGWLSGYDLRVVSRPSLEHVQAVYSAILFLNDPKQLSAYCDFVLQMGSVGRIAIIGRKVPEREVELLRSVSGQKAIAVIDLDDGEPLAEVGSQLLAALGDGRPLHVVATAFPTQHKAKPGEELTLAESATVFALRALVADPSLELVVAEPDWRHVSRMTFPRRKPVLAGDPVPDRLVERKQCFCRMMPGQWSEDFIHRLLEASSNDDPWDIWDVLRGPAALLRFEQRAIISVEPDRVARSPELLYGQLLA